MDVGKLRDFVVCFISVSFLIKSIAPLA